MASMNDAKPHRELFQASAEAQDKFDYFMCATSGALVAYIVQTYEPQQIGWATASLEPVAILLLAGSFIFGLKRIEAVNVIKSATARIHFEADQMSEITTVLASLKPSIDRSGNLLDPNKLAEKRELHESNIVSLETQKTKFQKGTKTYYRLRNWSLLAGFIAIFIAKLGQPYAQNRPPKNPVYKPTNQVAVGTNSLIPAQKAPAQKAP
jgi:hypothetical protein